ncbi:MAG TPA: DUF4044 domain-containing protein [Clostridium sp.]|uniref:DUF4044 domain-containing protein n=1 Tax=Clostridium lapidicellarium TaxID=3240931 RepID=A0ABV4DSD5_9CLOT|nr:DUF4044 domain-containing protein [uncultured Clostridium sp.]NLU07302.1 DUF4044 domain-containing protein [Clostridiales bacterium]HBC97701.1 DUF4044 domain-containing protein [Clostridium sp.]
MKKKTRDRMTRALVVFVVFIFILGLLPMLFR